MIKKIKQSSKGFTLIELLVVFSVISIITGVGLASFSSYSRRQTTYQTAATLQQKIDLSKFNALSRVKPSACGSNNLSAYKFNFCQNASPSCTTAGASYEIVALCGSVSSVIDSGTIPSGVTLANISGQPTCGTITFNTITSLNSGIPCSIRVSGYGYQFDMSISSQGYVSF